MPPYGKGTFASDGVGAGRRAACSPLASCKSALAGKEHDISKHWQCFFKYPHGSFWKICSLTPTRLLHGREILTVPVWHMNILGREEQRCALASIWPPARVLIPWTSPLLSVLLCPSPRQHQGSSPSDVLHARGSPRCYKKIWALKELSCNTWAWRGGLCNHCSTSTFTTPLFPLKLSIFKVFH